MLLLTASSQAQELGIPNVSTDQMASKINHVTGGFYILLSKNVLYIALVCLVIAIIGFIASAGFKSSKGMRGFGIGILCVLLGIGLFYLAPDLVGWMQNLTT